MKCLFQKCCVAQLLFLASGLILNGQGLLEDHTDITFSYSTDNEEWESELKHGGSFENPNTSTPLDAASLPARDIPAWSGNRFVQPNLSNYDFTGIPDGDPLWIFPQSDPPDYDYAWPGFRNDQAPGTFRAYDPEDARLMTRLPVQPWVAIELKGMSYVGTATNPTFSAWQAFSSGAIVPWMTSDDGIDSSDVFYLGENAHSHLNFGFSNLGLYRIALQPSAILDSTGETVEGAPEGVTFAIGTKASWLATHYAGDDLFNEAVSGDESDSDRDGIRLLLEYAFNLSPVLADVKMLEPTTGTSGLPTTRLVSEGENTALQIEYIRRKASTNPQINYFAEFKSDLGPGDWTVQTVETVTSIDDTWERVTVVDTFDTSETDQCFARVRVEMKNSISY